MLFATCCSLWTCQLCFQFEFEMFRIPLLSYCRKISDSTSYFIELLLFSFRSEVDLSGRQSVPDAFQRFISFCLRLLNFSQLQLRLPDVLFTAFHRLVTVYFWSKHVILLEYVLFHLGPLILIRLQVILIHKCFVVQVLRLEFRKHLLQFWDLAGLCLKFQKRICKVCVDFNLFSCKLCHVLQRVNENLHLSELSRLSPLPGLTVKYHVLEVFNKILCILEFLRNLLLKLRVKWSRCFTYEGFVWHIWTNCL